MRSIGPVIAAAALAACAIEPQLQPGQTEADALRAFGRPTGRYALPGEGGGTRLEFAQGTWGWRTWMVDLDAQGRVSAVRNVLDERNLWAVQGQVAGMTREQLLRTLGHPGDVQSGGWQGGQVWSWRYWNPFCLWFQSSIGDDGIVRDGVFSPDPDCEAHDRGGP